jgi:hypothetical protein
MSARGSIAKIVRENFDDMLWLADEDPLKLDALTRMPLLEYFILLDKRVRTVKRTIKNAQKNGNATGNSRVHKRH